MTLERFTTILKASVLALLLFIEGYWIYRYYGKQWEEEAEAKAAVHHLLAIDAPITVEMGERIIDTLGRLEREERLASLTVVLDTPGGSPAASENLYRYFKALGERAHLYMYVNSVAASGGYYVAVASPTIYANKNAMVGSVGVLMQSVGFSELAKELGISDETLSAGEFKTLLSPLKAPDEKMRAYIRDNLLAPVYANFAGTVAAERRLNAAQQRDYFEGRLFIAGDPRVKGVLVDETLSYPEMLERVKEKEGTKTLRRVDYTPKVEGFVSRLFKTVASQVFAPDVQFN
jgi:protease IV